MPAYTSPLTRSIRALDWCDQQGSATRAIAGSAVPFRSDPEGADPARATTSQSAARISATGSHRQRSHPLGEASFMSAPRPDTPTRIPVPHRTKAGGSGETWTSPLRTCGSASETHCCSVSWPHQLPFACLLNLGFGGMSGEVEKHKSRRVKHGAVAGGDSISLVISLVQRATPSRRATPHRLSEATNSRA
jgi:hypothetical protein